MAIPMLDIRGAELAKLALCPKLVAACEEVTECVSAPPPNCSCHISPPCRDCTDWMCIREMLAIVNDVLAKAEAIERG